MVAIEFFSQDSLEGAAIAALWGEAETTRLPASWAAGRPVACWGLPGGRLILADAEGQVAILTREQVEALPPFKARVVG